MQYIEYIYVHIFILKLKAIAKLKLHGHYILVHIGAICDIPYISKLISCKENKITIYIILREIDLQYVVE